MMKSLICMVTCNRLDHVKQNIIPYIQFVKQNNKSFSFLLANDGYSEDYINFCVQYNIPLLYSDEREGVGLSKNRVVKQFPNFDNYFFIEDDVELFDSNLFSKYIDASKLYNIHHFNLTPVKGEWPQTIDSLVCGKYGGAVLQFYTKYALESVGGWHTLFATYRRFGHTEHTYRCFYKNLTPAPFVYLKNTLNNILIHHPSSVTKTNTSLNNNLLVEEEQTLIDNQFEFYPLKTICKFHYNQKDLSLFNTAWLSAQTNRYFLLSINKKRKAWSSFLFHIFQCSKNPLLIAFYFFLAFILWPTNLFIKHKVKSTLKGILSPLKTSLL